MRVIIIRSEGEIVGCVVVNDADAAAAEARVRAVNRFGYVVHNILADTLDDTVEFLDGETADDDEVM